MKLFCLLFAAVFLLARNQEALPQQPPKRPAASPLARRPVGGYGLPPARIQFEQLTVADGLPENAVRSIIQDHLGYLWLSTQNGLVHYDGSNHGSCYGKGPDMEPRQKPAGGLF